MEGRVKDFKRWLGYVGRATTEIALLLLLQVIIILCVITILEREGNKRMPQMDKTFRKNILNQEGRDEKGKD